MCSAKGSSLPKDGTLVSYVSILSHYHHLGSPFGTGGSVIRKVSCQEVDVTKGKLSKGRMSGVLNVG